MAGVQDEINRLFPGPLNELKLPRDPVPELDFLPNQADAPRRVIPIPHRERPAPLPPAQLPVDCVLHDRHLFWRNQGQ